MPSIKNTDFPREQRHLFVGVNVGEIRSWADLEESTPQGRLEMLVGDNIGPHSNVAERAERIIGILDKISKRNSLNGLSYGVEFTEYKKPIWERYLNGTPNVIRNSRNKARRFDDEITVDIANLTGVNKLKGGGFFTVRSVTSWLEKNDRDFRSLYGPTNQILEDHGISPLRIAYRETQLGFLPEDHPLRSKPAKKKTSSNLAA